jgi:cytochrome c-type biogenesis protein
LDILARAVSAVDRRIPELEVSYAGAAAAGLLSFLSPCVLPLVPAYLCFLGGVSLDQLVGDKDNADGSYVRSTTVLSSALFFVLGFSVVFIAFGASASALSGLLLSHKILLGRIAGVIIIVFGLHYMGLFRLRWLNLEARFHPDKRPSGLTGAFIIGLAFAFGWTPCIGPVLATILTVAAREESISAGVSLLAAYAAGLGIPFLLAAFIAGPFISWMARMRRHMRKVEIATGGLLVATGLLFVTSSFEIIGFWLIEQFPVLGRIG